MRHLLQNVPVDIHVELGSTELKGRELLSLNVGDIIPLNKFMADDLDVVVQGMKKFHAQPGTFHGNNAIQITKLVERR